MKYIRTYKYGLYAGLIFILIAGLVLYPAGNDAGAEEQTELNLEDLENQADTEEQPEDEKADSNQENSGGFIIKSEEVKGNIDIIGSLFGKINISKGTIKGLTITKELNTGSGKDPMVIQITSPGPVEVTNLSTETLNGGMPELGGICGLIPVCLSDVVMEVDHQDVDRISIPNAKIKTCFASECGIDESELASAREQKEIKDVLLKMEEQQLSLEEIKEGIEEDKTKLGEVKELVEQVSAGYATLEDEQQVEQLEAGIAEIESILGIETPGGNDEPAEEEDSDKEKAINIEIPKNLDPAKLNKTAEKTQEVNEKFTETAEGIFDKLKSLSEAFKELDKSVQLKEKALAEIEKELDEMKEDGQIEKAEMYAALKELAGKDEKELKKLEGSSEDELKLDDLFEKLDVDEVKKALEALRKDVDETGESIDKLEKKEKKLEKRNEQILERWDVLKKTMKEVLKEKGQEDEQKQEQAEEGKKDTEKDSKNEQSGEKQQPAANDTSKEESEADETSREEDTEEEEETEDSSSWSLTKRLFGIDLGI